MERVGLVGRGRGVFGGQSVVWATGRAVEDVRVPQLVSQGLRHRVGVAAVAGVFGWFGDEVSKPVVVGRGRVGGGRWTKQSEANHVVDVVVSRPGSVGVLAVEVELAVKSPRRLAAILKDFQDRVRSPAGDVSRVLYVCSPGAGRAVRRAAPEGSEGWLQVVEGFDAAGLPLAPSELVGVLDAAGVREWVVGARAWDEGRVRELLPSVGGGSVQWWRGPRRAVAKALIEAEMGVLAAQTHRFAARRDEINETLVPLRQQVEAEEKALWERVREQAGREAVAQVKKPLWMRGDAAAEYQVQVRLATEEWERVLFEQWSTGGMVQRREQVAALEAEVEGNLLLWKEVEERFGKLRERVKELSGE